MMMMMIKIFVSMIVYIFIHSNDGRYIHSSLHFCLNFNWYGFFLNFYSTGEAMWLATNVSDTLDSYTVIAWWLCDCLWDMTHCFQLAGITLLWIAGVKIGWEIPQLQCILAHMIGENFHHILGHWLSCCASHLCNTVQGHCTVHQISTRQPGWEAINSLLSDTMKIT